MSLINEALKRAKQIQGPDATATGPSLQAAGRPHHPDAGVGLWLPVLMAVVLSVSVVLLWQWFHSGAAVQVRARTSVEASTPAGLVAPATPPAAPAPAITAVATTPAPAFPARSLAAPAGGTSSNLVALAPDSPPAADPEPSKPQPVTYKLQSLFFRPKSPSAVINGKTLFVGDRVGEARVVAIGRDSATIVTLSGQTNLLELP